MDRRQRKEPVTEERRAFEKDLKSVPSWRWVAEIAVAIILLITGAFLSETRSDVKAITAAKLDKDAYYRDVSEIKSMITELRGDIKELTKTKRDL